MSFLPSVSAGVAIGYLLLILDVGGVIAVLAGMVVTTIVFQPLRKDASPGSSGTGVTDSANAGCDDRP